MQFLGQFSTSSAVSPLKLFYNIVGLQDDCYPNQHQKEKERDGQLYRVPFSISDRCDPSADVNSKGQVKALLIPPVLILCTESLRDQTEQFDPSCT